jgi:hypothetical protein
MRLIFYYARVIIEVLGVGLAREIHTFLRASQENFYKKEARQSLFYSSLPRTSIVGAQPII